TVCLIHHLVRAYVFVAERIVNRLARNRDCLAVTRLSVEHRGITYPRLFCILQRRKDPDIKIWPVELVVNEIRLVRIRNVAISENTVKLVAIIRRGRNIRARQVGRGSGTRKNVRKKGFRCPLVRPKANRNRDRKLPMSALVAESCQWRVKYLITSLGIHG